MYIITANVYCCKIPKLSLFVQQARLLHSLPRELVLLLCRRRLLVEDDVLDRQYGNEGEEEPVPASAGRFPRADVVALQAGLDGEADGAADLGLKMVVDVNIDSKHLLTVTYEYLSPRTGDAGHLGRAVLDEVDSVERQRSVSSTQGRRFRDRAHAEAKYEIMAPALPRTKAGKQYFQLCGGRQLELRRDLEGKGAH